MAAEPRAFVALDYEMRLNGILVAELQVDAAVGRDSYNLSSTMRTRGLMDLLLGYKSFARARGQIETQAEADDGVTKVVPETHRNDSVWMDETRKVSIDYGPYGPQYVEVVPLPADEGRDQVTADLRLHTQDLLSAVMQLSLWAADGTVCQSRALVFDGRRRYNLEFSPATSKKSNHKADFLCSGKLLRLAGRSSESWLPRSRVPREFELWMRTIDPDLPPVPVRLKAFSGIGWIVAQLVNHSRDQRPVKSASGDDNSD